MLVRLRGPACSQLLPECEPKGEGAGVGAGSLVTRLANSKAELVSLSQRFNTLTPNFAPKSPELQNRVARAGRHFAFFLGLIW